MNSDHLLLVMLRRKNRSEMNVNWGKTLKGDTVMNLCYQKTLSACIKIHEKIQIFPATKEGLSPASRTLTI
jgi:hypothetical protein